MNQVTNLINHNQHFIRNESVLSHLLFLSLTLSISLSVLATHRINSLAAATVVVLLRRKKESAYKLNIINCLTPASVAASTSAAACHLPLT